MRSERKREEEKGKKERRASRVERCAQRMRTKTRGARCERATVRVSARERREREPENSKGSLESESKSTVNSPQAYSYLAWALFSKRIF